MSALFQFLPGDQFRISTRRMAASGTIIKVNRVTVAWASDYQPAPNGPVYKLGGKIARCEFVRCLVLRDGAVFTVLR